MKYFSFLLLTLLSLTTIGQDHFVSYIDIDNKPQLSSQMILSEDNVYLSCILGCGLDYTQCSGIIKTNLNGGDKLNVLSIDSFSNNSNGLLLRNDEFQFIGEFNMGRSESFEIISISSELDKIHDTISLSQNDSKYYNYFATGSIFFNRKLCTIGSSFGQNEYPQVGHLYVSKEGKIDTSLIFKLADNGYTVATEVHTLNLKDELTIYFRYKDFGKSEDSVKIIRLDTSFNQTFEWSMEVPRNYIPRGCVTQDDDMIITVPNYTWSSIRDIWSISQSGQVNWRYKWPDTKGSRNILRIEEAINQDLFVMGEIVTPNLFNDARPTAFVMRLDAKGNEIWRRYFRSENEHRALSGYVSDLEELENGDLLLTGKSTRILYEDGEERLDQDIFWARIGGDGCINGDCSEVYTITSTEDQLTPLEDPVSIYPNPIVDGQLTIDVKDHSVQSVWIYDVSGQLIRHQKLEYGTTSVSLEGNNSIYFIRIVDDEGRLVHAKKVLSLQ
jgi:hypothetical protein